MVHYVRSGFISGTNVEKHLVKRSGGRETLKRCKENLEQISPASFVVDNSVDPLLERRSITKHHPHKFDLNQIYVPDDDGTAAQRMFSYFVLFIEFIFYCWNIWIWLIFSGSNLKRPKKKLKRKVSVPVDKG